MLPAKLHQELLPGPRIHTSASQRNLRASTEDRRTCVLGLLPTHACGSRKRGGGGQSSFVYRAVTVCQGPCFMPFLH